MTIAFTQGQPAAARLSVSRSNAKKARWTAGVARLARGLRAGGGVEVRAVVTGLRVAALCVMAREKRRRVGPTKARGEGMRVEHDPVAWWAGPQSTMRQRTPGLSSRCR